MARQKKTGRIKPGTKGAKTKRVSAASLVTVEKNYKRFAPLHLDESQIILRPRVYCGDLRCEDN